ncbi:MULTISPECIES: GNAT family N-acetyltransferase [Halolamina]|uniref:Ribosomal-protein-alanine N-acetyltransferase n=1 Tax=Halolamina pelagica TaxID=699431 RepID=A0A1I5QTZ4_9EURY|nr:MULTISPECIES: GNAT family N-acetyltransferase [Halolamina]NHX35535.1 GNAT family N-acetyltransferase [Halolamina sp. R1-12]SFP49557.1 ribosomal-protein-alanine N-acetyltransferase [Halolamina pelagica]
MIREGRPADRPAVRNLQQFLPEPAPELLAPVAGGELFVSTESGAVVGYLLWFPGDPVHAAELVVHPDHRREGRGRALFRALFDRLDPGTAVVLRVAAGNEGARELYRELGFERLAVEPDAYDDGAGYLLRAVAGDG